jgi:hypothetical protein
MPAPPCWYVAYHRRRGHFRTILPPGFSVAGKAEMECVGGMGGLGSFGFCAAHFSEGITR